MKLFTKLFILSAAVTALSGCRSDLLDTVPYDKAASNSMWTNENFCELGVTGVYHELREDYIAKKAYELEAYCVSGSCRDNDYSILAGTASTGSGLFSDYWKQHYEGIQRANDAISHLAEAPVPDAFKNKLIAEVKILRAFFYYKLNAVFRGVPYYDVPVLITEANKPPKQRNRNMGSLCERPHGCHQRADIARPYCSRQCTMGTRNQIRCLCIAW